MTTREKVRILKRAGPRGHGSLHRPGSAVFVMCPDKKCNHIFDSAKTFWWGADHYGDPTVENIYCPKCLASTKPRDRRRTQWNWDDFKEVPAQPNVKDHP